MSADDPSLDLDAVRSVVDEVIEQLRDHEGRVHLDTALAGLAAVAGAALLRSVAGSWLDELEPGGHVVVDQVDEQGPQLLALVASVARNSGLAWPDGIAEIPADHRPALPPAELVGRLEPPLTDVLADRGVAAADRPVHLALACVDLALRSGPVLDPPSAASIVATGIVAGSKTVPPRHRDES
jgi:hypothetical protein